MKEERREEDEEQCRMIIGRELGIEIEKEKIEAVVRLGRVQERRVRPILLKMKVREDKFTVLNNAKKLKHSGNERARKVRIAPDLTVREREAERELRGELRERRGRVVYQQG